MSVFPLAGNCHECGLVIVRRTEAHRFCTSRCRRKWNKRKYRLTGNPQYRCTNCRAVCQLKFDPKTAPDSWRGFRCGGCGFSPYDPKEEAPLVIMRARS